MGDGEYRCLHDDLLRYRQRVEGLLSPFKLEEEGLPSLFNPCPSEVIVRILQYATSEIRVDDFPERVSHPIPHISCVPLTKFAVLSRRFHSLVTTTPSLFSRIRLRRHRVCHSPHPLTTHRINRLLNLAASHPLDVVPNVVEDFDADDDDDTPPERQSMSSCSHMALLRAKSWKSFTFYGDAPLLTGLLIDPSIFPSPITLSLTTIRVMYTPSLEDLLSALAHTILPLRCLTLYVPNDPNLRVPDFRIPPTRKLPDTISHLDIAGSSRTALYFLSSVPHLLSASIILTSGRHSDSGNWKYDGPFAPEERRLHRPVIMPALTSMVVTDDDGWGTIVPDFFRWVTTPVLDQLELRWVAVRELPFAYLDSLNAFFSRTPLLRRVHLFDTPYRVNSLNSLPADCSAQWFRTLETPKPIMRRSSSEHSEPDIYGYQIESDESDGNLSDASNGFEFECDCWTRLCNNQSCWPKRRRDLAREPPVYVQFRAFTSSSTR
ncbi:hypothetical protein VNI00_014302 [Paramarasmius palmivorus]|uniref:F-box domain-containing protein n=1 Tax=Paramarasmius palmivorus TaxID=297713 RepID=A0AAW0BV50_9AGAR